VLDQFRGVAARLMTTNLPKEQEARLNEAFAEE
jgi:uncharacterized membrane protein